MEFVVLDTETTGLSPYKGCRLIEIAAVIIRDFEISEMETFNELIDPERPIPIFITQLTGINSRMVRGKPRFDEVYKRLLDFIQDRTLIIQNAGFDLSFLDYYADYYSLETINNPYVDTISLSRYLFTGHHNLDMILARLNIIAKDRHRALGDVIATGEAFIKMTEKIGKENLKEFIKKRKQKS